MQKMNLRKYKLSYYFIVICFTSFILSVLLNEFIITNKVFYNSYADKLNIERIRHLYELISQIKWINYIISPLGYFLKFLIITLILLTGDIIFETKIGFKKLFGAVVIAESIFLIQEAAKVFWFLFIEKPETISDIGRFNILSIYSLFTENEIYPWLIYPFKVANVFELLYWIVLAYLIKIQTEIEYDKALKLVLSTYVPAVLIWIIFIMYLSI
jgi:hypothetical protein